jgi:hypothetical protein
MLDMKNQLKRMPYLANTNPKVFLKKMEEKFDEEKIAVYASKILMYSRKMDIGKIAEVLGGKSENAKKVLKGYVAIQNFRNNKI